MKATWIVLIAVLVGCTATGGYVPVAPIEMKDKMVRDYPAPTAIHVEPITGRGSVGRKFVHQGKELPAVFNLDEMSMYVANSLSAELVKKGATLDIQSERVIRVEVLDVDISYSSTYQVSGTVQFELSDGYVGTCNFGGSGVKAYRALGGALQWGVANIINHNSVQSFLEEGSKASRAEVSPSDRQRYTTEGKYKLAILPFKAGALEDTDSYQKKAVASIIASMNASENIALTHSCYNPPDSDTANANIIKIDDSVYDQVNADIWEESQGRYTINETVISQYASMLDVDVIYTCQVSCEKTGMFAVCGKMVIEPYLYSSADNRILHKMSSMRMEMPGGQVALQRDYYSSDEFYLELKKASSLLFEEYISSNPDVPKRKGLTVQ